MSDSSYVWRVCNVLPASSKARRLQGEGVTAGQAFTHFLDDMAQHKRAKVGDVRFSRWTRLQNNMLQHAPMSDPRAVCSLHEAADVARALDNI